MSLIAPVAEVFAKLVEEGREVDLQEGFFWGEVMGISDFQVLVRPDSSADGVWIGPIPVIGSVPAITARVLCLKVKSGVVALGAIAAGGGAVGARVRASGGFTIGTGTYTTLGPFGVTEYDTGGFTSVGSRLTCVNAGLYSFAGGATFDAIANAVRNTVGGGGGGGTFDMNTYLSSITINLNTSTAYGFGTVFWDDQYDGVSVPIAIAFDPFTVAGGASYSDNDDDLTKNDRKIRLLLNGATVIAESSHPVVDNDTSKMNISTLWKCNAGDYVQLQVFHDRGANHGISAGAYLAAHSAQ